MLYGRRLYCFSLLQVWKQTPSTRSIRRLKVTIVWLQVAAHTAYRSVVRPQEGVNPLSMLPQSSSSSPFSPRRDLVDVDSSMVQVLVIVVIIFWAGFVFLHVHHLLTQDFQGVSRM
jgi:hypothetical protein